MDGRLRTVPHAAGILRGSLASCDAHSAYIGMEEYGRGGGCVRWFLMLAKLNNYCDEEFIYGSCVHVKQGKREM
jgi:hypothetical protein